jgi:predicted O-linked N-acetylglucosamine transferase (SPINDLY family)
MSDTEAAARMQADRIHVLVELNGWTSYARMGLVALRPAPVQASYLGYCATSGAPFLDYYLSDRIASPPFAQADFSEKLVLLPHVYQVERGCWLLCA